jgi:hypothetical protein
LELYLLSRHVPPGHVAGQLYMFFTYVKIYKEAVLAYIEIWRDRRKSPVRKADNLAVLKRVPLWHGA